MNLLLIRKWSNSVSSVLVINSSYVVNNTGLHFADYQVVTDELEDHLHTERTVFHVELKDFRGDCMALNLKDYIRSEIVVNFKTFEQVRQFQYLRWGVSYKKDHDVRNEITSS